jgi:hypothetical protein
MNNIKAKQLTCFEQVADVDKGEERGFALVDIVKFL